MLGDSKHGQAIELIFPHHHFLTYRGQNSNRVPLIHNIVVGITVRAIKSCKYKFVVEEWVSNFREMEHCLQNCYLFSKFALK